MDPQWKNIFEKMAIVPPNINENTSLETLLNIAGHLNSKTGKFGIDLWNKTIEEIKKNINYDSKNKYKILEIGCGCGALLKSFEGNILYGIDSSENMINIINKVFPKGTFKNIEAININFKTNFDIIISHSCFQYFPNIDYLKNVLNIIIKTTNENGYIVLSELMDYDKKQPNIDHRISIIGKERYKELYSNLNHLYIEKKFIIDYLSKYFTDITITNSPKRDEPEWFRFNLYARRNNKLYESS
jgi:ubiquinone/menaquinone biosynthesis C-methylase UbiE